MVEPANDGIAWPDGTSDAAGPLDPDAGDVSGARPYLARAAAGAEGPQRLRTLVLGIRADLALEDDGEAERGLPDAAGADDAHVHDVCAGARRGGTVEGGVGDV